MVCKKWVIFPSFRINCNWPLSIFESSNNWSTNSSILLAFLSIKSNCFCCSFEDCFFNCWTGLLINVSGVLNSWEIFAKNRDFKVFNSFNLCAVLILFLYPKNIKKPVANDNSKIVI